MTLSNFLSKLNWRLILIHFVATWFIFHALWQLGYLYDYDFLEDIMHHNFKSISNHEGPTVGERLSTLLLRAILIGLVGVLISFAISLLLSAKYKWYWVNSSIVFFIAFITCCFHRFYWSHIRFIFQAPGSLFKLDWANILANGLVMLTIGLLLFFNKRLIRFINGNTPDHVNP